MVSISLFLQREGAEDVLDFWLDVQQHENLCRAYFKDVRKSGKTVKEDWPQFWEYARRRGSIYGNVVGAGASKRSTVSSGDADPEKRPLSSQGHHSRPGTPGNMQTGWGDAKDPHAYRDYQEAPPRSSTPFSLNLGRRSTTMSKRASRAPTFIPRDSAITRTDLIASAERIFARYLLPSSDKEIYLPPSLRIHEFPLSSHQLPNPTSPNYEVEASALAQVPDMFHAQKEYVFRAMEQDAFPRFLRAKAFGNLTPVSALARLCLGLVALWAGLAAAFALIFLDVKPKAKRFFVSILRLRSALLNPFLTHFLISSLFHSQSPSCVWYLTNTSWTQFSFSLTNPKQRHSELCPFTSLMFASCCLDARSGFRSSSSS